MGRAEWTQVDIENLRYRLRALDESGSQWEPVATVAAARSLAGDVLRLLDHQFPAPHEQEGDTDGRP